METTTDETTRIRPARRTEAVGEYYFSRKLAEVRALDAATVRVINLGIGSPDLAPPATAVGALVEGLSAPDAHRYQSYRGIPALRRAIARFSAGIYGLRLDPESMVLPLMGSKEGLLHVSLAFLDPGDEVLFPDPGYPTYRSAALLAGATPLPYALREERGWAPDLGELASRDLSRVRLMWINTPHMPTGRSAPRAELEALVALARRHRILLVNDNPYGPLADGEPLSRLSVDGAADVAMELGSLSKSHNLAGWRVGWIAGAPAYVDAVLRARSNADSGMFLPVQLAAAEALAQPRGALDDLRRTYATRREIANRLLERLGCRVGGGQSGVFVWAKAPDAIAEVEGWLDEILREARVFIAPGSVFGENGRRFVRLSLCSPEETLREAAARIDAFAAARVSGRAAS
ncbi:MAG TPA: aminotransferase class I/II-fold pyridoxal phosphate-dependent enzyme [Thermoanaerobaculia bacterium]